MNLNKFYSILVVGLLAFFLVSCRTSLIQNIHHNAVTQKVSANQVKSAIIRAGQKLNWTMTNAKPGLIVATLNLRQHQAVVNITYTAKSYSILYKSSKNLDYDGTTIHKNYNGWIENLNHGIQKELSYN
ncbi:MAG: hypothetical protein JKY13_03525 [Gammaproteobacteria bacterium]|nr:hypothetical protein [Gammaproteobacteria bacterium]